jgi:hypothetical protein
MRTDHLVIGRKILRDLLACALVRGRGGAAPGQDDDRQRADEGFGDGGDQVGRARPGGHATDAGLPGELRVPCRHVAGDLLVPHQDVPHLRRVVERVVDAERMAAGNPEHRLDTLGPEHIHDGAACADFHFASRSVCAILAGLPGQVKSMSPNSGRCCENPDPLRVLPPRRRPAIFHDMDFRGRACRMKPLRQRSCSTSRD